MLHQLQTLRSNIPQVMFELLIRSTCASKYQLLEYIITTCSECKIFPAGLPSLLEARIRGLKGA